MSNTLTPSDVQALFTYDDGVLYWAVKQASKIRIGDPAGSLNKRNGGHVVVINGGHYTRARLCWAWHRGEWPLAHVWHLNRLPADDRIENLIDRSAPNFPDAVKRNRKLPMGVTRTPSGTMRANCKAGHIGTFPTEAEAHEAYLQANTAKYARVNGEAEAGA